MKALLIYHEKAGGGKLSREEAVTLVERAGWSVETLTRKKASATKIARAEPDVIVVAGGDGTVGRIACCVPDRSVPLALLPTGTANNIARSLAIAGGPDSAAAAWNWRKRERLDVGRVTADGSERPFVESVGFGAFASSLARARDVDGMDKIDVGRRALRVALAEAQPLTFGLSLDGTDEQVEALLIEAMNTQVTGPWLRLCPDGDPGDGHLDVVILAPEAREAMVQWLDGVSESPPPLRHLRASRIEVDAGPCTMRIDDEVRNLARRTRITLTLESEPLQVLAPIEELALSAPERKPS